MVCRVCGIWDNIIMVQYDDWTFDEVCISCYKWAKWKIIYLSRKEVKTNAAKRTTPH